MRAEQEVCRACPYPVVRIAGRWWHDGSHTDGGYVPHAPVVVSRLSKFGDGQGSPYAYLGPETDG